MVTRFRPQHTAIVSYNLPFFSHRGNCVQIRLYHKTNKETQSYWSNSDGQGLQSVLNTKWQRVHTNKMVKQLMFSKGMLGWVLVLCFSFHLQFFSVNFMYAQQLF